MTIRNQLKFVWRRLGTGIQEEDWVDGAGIIPVTQRLTVNSEDASVWENT